MREHYEPLLGELSGRTRIPLRGLPTGCEAVTVPVRRNGEAKIPKDRRRRVKVSHVDLVAADPVPLFEPPPNLATAELIWILSAGRRQWASVLKRFGDRADAVALSLVRAGGIVLRCGVDLDELTIRTPDGWSLSTAWSEQAVDEIADLRPQRDPDDVRRELLGLLDGLTPPTLAAERAALATVPARSPLAPPPGTVSGAKS